MRFKIVKRKDKYIPMVWNWFYFRWCGIDRENFIWNTKQFIEDYCIYHSLMDAKIIIKNYIKKHKQKKTQDEVVWRGNGKDL